MDRQNGFYRAFKIDQAMQYHGQNRRATLVTKPAEHQPNPKHLSHVVRIILHMSEGPEQRDYNDYGPDVTGRAVPASKEESAKQRFLADWCHHNDGKQQPR